MAVLDITHDRIGTGLFHPFHGQVWQVRFNYSGKAADLYISGPSQYLGSDVNVDTEQGGLSAHEGSRIMVIMEP